MGRKTNSIGYFNSADLNRRKKGWKYRSHRCVLKISN
jgi:hypothetical protein